MADNVFSKRELMADDWHRSSFFDLDTEDLVAVATPDTAHSEESSVDEFAIQFGDANNNQTRDSEDDDDNNNQDDNEDDDGFNASFLPSNEDNDDENKQNTETDDIPKSLREVSDNPIMNELVGIMIDRFEHLVRRGFLNATFLNKVKDDPQEILRFIRQNRAVVGDQLNRRLDPRIRPKPDQLESMGIVPKGYFKHGHENAMTRKHRRKSTATQDLAALIQLRPNPEQLVAKGIVDRSTMERYTEIDDEKLEQHELGYSIKDAMQSNMLSEEKENDEHKIESDMNRNGEIINQLQEENAADQRESQLQEMQDYYASQRGFNGMDQTQQQSQSGGGQTWEISILNTLLFKTIAEALRKSCIDTQKQEALVLLQMEEMNNEMKHLRDALDKYFLNDEPDVLLFQKEEEMIRDKFHGIQKKLLNISTKQNSIHEKLRILHSVEKKMVDLQNMYDKQLGQLRKNEEEVLKDLKEQRIRREKAIKIRIAEKSHSNWAMAKLDYTISIASKTNQGKDDEFVGHLDSFLKKLQSISENQNNIVRDFDFAIDELESHLLSIRHNMSKVRTMTFKKIYDLHKQVEIAESLELGNRRLSVASATEIERERRHYTTKIQRQLNTLKNQIKIFNYKAHEKNMREIIDIQLVMSENKMKSFFSVFTQCFSQTLCDIDLCYQNLNCLIDDDKKQEEENNDHLKLDPSFASSASSDDEDIELYATKKNQRNALQSIQDENKIKIRKLCMELYGITNVLQKISLLDDDQMRSKKKKRKHDLSLVEKIIHCMKFIQICNNAITYEIQKAYHEMNRVNGLSGSNIKIAADTVRTNEIVIVIGRKLTIDKHTLEDIDMTPDDQIPVLAQMRVQSIFKAIIKAQDLNQIFKQKKLPTSHMKIATDVLKYVFGIDNNEQNDSYLN